MVSLSNRPGKGSAATARRILGIVAVAAWLCPSCFTGGLAAAVELVDRNPFDPHRRPWQAAPPAAPELPVLTPQDLQIEAIVSFGAMRGIIAQLDGKLRGTLPGNAAGKVRIAVGQSFGAGYVLESISANQAVVLGGSARSTIPVLRKMTRGAAPTPATMAIEQRAAPPAPVASPPSSVPGVVGLAPAPAAQAEAAIAPVAPVPPPPASAPPLATQAGRETPPAAAPQSPQQQPMSLLEAIQAAQAAARNQQGSPPPIVNPFTAPKK